MLVEEYGEYVDAIMDLRQGLWNKSCVRSGLAREQHG
jgi:hypothetical protein